MALETTTNGHFLLGSMLAGHCTELGSTIPLVLFSMCLTSLDWSSAIPIGQRCFGIGLDRLFIGFTQSTSTAANNWMRSEYCISKWFYEWFRIQIQDWERKIEWRLFESGYDRVGSGYTGKDYCGNILKTHSPIQPLLKSFSFLRTHYQINILRRGQIQL